MNSKNYDGNYRIREYWFVSNARQILEGISFLYQLIILHNDIKADNANLLGEFRTALKIIEKNNITLKFY